MTRTQIIWYGITAVALGVTVGKAIIRPIDEELERLWVDAQAQRDEAWRELILGTKS